MVKILHTENIIVYSLNIKMKSEYYLSFPIQLVQLNRILKILISDCV